MTPPSNPTLIVRLTVAVTAVGKDYTVDSPGMLVFNATESSVCVTIDTTDNTIFEEDKTFTVQLTTEDPQVILSLPTAQVLIVENDSELVCREGEGNGMSGGGGGGCLCVIGPSMM